MQTMRPQQNTI